MNVYFGINKSNCKNIAPTKKKNHLYKFDNNNKITMKMDLKMIGVFSKLLPNLKVFTRLFLNNYFVIGMHNNYLAITHIF